MTTRKQDIELIKNHKKAITVIIGNQKGGVGKTTNTYLISYILAKWGIKTLVCDLDPQANSSKTLLLTKSQSSNEILEIRKTLMYGVQQGNLANIPVKILDNLYLLPSYTDFKDFAKFLYQNTDNKHDEVFFLKPLFEPLKEDYDVILIDVPPLSIEVTENAAAFSDYVLISLQTQDDSLSGAEEYLNILAELKQEFDLPIEVLGILPMLSDRRGSVDQKILQDATKQYGKDNIFSEIVPLMARIKRFSMQGISEKDRFDEKVLDKYKKVTKEFLDRLYDFESSKETNLFEGDK